MGLEHKQGEAFRNTNGAEPGSDNVQAINETSRIVAVRGNAFYQDFLEAAVVPVRRDVATMALAKLTERWDPHEDPIDDMVERAFEIADAFCLADKRTLEKSIAKYFEQYLAGGTMEEMLTASIEAAKDYSLNPE